MITFEVNEAELKTLENRLQNMPDDARNTLKIAINKTAKQARSRIATQAKLTYAAKTGRFNKNMKIQNAKKSNLVATISTNGKAMELMDFRASPAKVPNPSNRPKVTKGKVLRTNSLKNLEKNGIKAFVARFKSGHVAVVERVPGKTMKSDPKKEALRKLLSPSIPQMVGNEEKVLDIVQPYIHDDLQIYMSNHILKILGG